MELLEVLGKYSKQRTVSERLGKFRMRKKTPEQESSSSQIGLDVIIYPTVSVPEAGSEDIFRCGSASTRVVSQNCEACQQHEYIGFPKSDSPCLRL